MSDSSLTHTVKKTGKVKVNDFRISHNEPLCFNNKVFDMTYASDMYVMIRDFLNWIDPQIVTSLCKERLGHVEAEIKCTIIIINS